MYGILLESVQEYIIQECGEEIWLTILRESGAKNTVFNTHQLYPDAVMLRLASALARFVTKDPNSPSSSTPPTPLLKQKPSIKKRSSLRKCPERPRTQSAKCPFSSTAAIKEITKQHIASYRSHEEIYKNSEETKIETPFIIEYLNDVSNATKKAKDQKEETKLMVKSLSATDKTTSFEQSVLSPKEKDAGALLKNRSFGGKISLDSSERIKNTPSGSIAEDVNENQSIPDADEIISISISKDTTSAVKDLAQTTSEIDPKKDLALIVSPSGTSVKDNSVSRMSRTDSGGLEMGRRSSAFSGILVGRRDSALSAGASQSAHGVNCKCCDKKAADLRAKFGTPEKVMYFFGRCFVKYFSAYG